MLAYDKRIPRCDPLTGKILTVWDGHTAKPHPVTGKEVPDETATIALFDYINPRRAVWPQADYIVGNPPFIGACRMREALGDGYTESLRKVWKGDVPESADFVMFWWRKAAERVRDGKALRFGFITTNSIHQTFNRRVIEPFVAAVCNRQAQLHLAYAIPDHPWIDSADGAAVRIAMTVAAPGHAEGILEKVISEQARDDGENEVTLLRIGGLIAPNLQIGADLGSSIALTANEKLAHRGVQTIGSGFIVTKEQASELGLGKLPGIEHHIRGYRNGRDLTALPRDVMVIDLFGLTADESAEKFPTLYQHVLVHVKPERDQNKRDFYRKNWWIFGEPRKELRPAIAGLSRYIATIETSKHRFFTFLDHSILPDNKLIAIAGDDAFLLGVLSSFIHVKWSLASGSWLGVGNDSVYVKSRCFEPFPFPALEEGELKHHIRDLGECLDAHRKRQQELHPDLTLTGIYNVLEKLRTGEALTAKDKTLHDQGLVTLLKQLHDDLDAAVLDAYGWNDLVVETQDFKTQDTRLESSAPGLLSSSSSLASCVLPSCVSPADLLARGGPAAEALEQQLLTRLVALNHERAAEEKRGLVRWLRPDYQNPISAAPQPVQATLQGTDPDSSQSKIQNQQSTIINPSSSFEWPADLPAQVAAVRKLLPTVGQDPDALAACFGRKSAKRAAQITAILATLRALGLLA